MKLDNKVKFIGLGVVILLLIAIIVGCIIGVNKDLMYEAHEEIDIVIGKEFEMIDTNIKAVHLLTKSFLRDMIDRDSGYILNVASSAGLMPGGPLMATYYATKSYITSLTNSVWYELKRKKSNVSISCLCPGPVATHFNDVAGVRFSAKPMKAEDVAEYAIDKMFERKRLIIPGAKMKMAHFFSRFVSEKTLLKAAYKIQNKKRKK